ncbi:MAG: TIR domain-containing protein, partial [Fimbriimonas sp.]
VPRAGDTQGWVTALHDAILADSRNFDTQPLRIFFDTNEIQDMDDWRHRILDGLRHSKILLVCLSPDYFQSPPCLWEWEEYLKRQVHALMGHESVSPIYFVEAPDSDEQMNAAWVEAVTRKVAPANRAEWEQKWKAWRKGTLDIPNYTDLQPWFNSGVNAMREEAVERKLAKLGDSLWERIRRARRATDLPGNLRRLNPHFIGRTTELRELHESATKNTVGIVTAVHGLGGQGKTELATAYARSYADCYPGGLWVVNAEKATELLPLIATLCGEIGIAVSVDGETADQRGRRALAELKRLAIAAKERDADGGAACLLILDNVSDPALLAEPQLSLLPQENWLRVVATTREGKDNFHVSELQSLAFVEVGALSEDDAARLIEDHQVKTNGHWPKATAEADAQAAREIARELGGFTLAVEQVAIFLGLHPEVRPADYLVRLLAGGLVHVDDLTSEEKLAKAMFHRDKQLGLILDQTLERLDPPAIAALEYAALLPPDSIPWPWLRSVVADEFPQLATSRPGHADPWLGIERRLGGLRLLTEGDGAHIARMHR